MSLVRVTVTHGEVDFLDQGFLGRDVRHETPYTVDWAVHAHHPVSPLPITDARALNAEQLKDIFDKFLNVVRNKMLADIKAPAVGSASSLFKKRSGSVEVEVLEGIAILRVYHKKQTEWTGADAREMAAYQYYDLDGKPTDDPWSHVLLVQGQKRSFDMIEDNAITVAFYT